MLKRFKCESKTILNTVFFFVSQKLNLKITIFFNTRRNINRRIHGKDRKMK